MTAGDWALFLAIVLGAAVAPGPNVILAMTVAARDGLIAGWTAMAGVISALFLMSLAAAMGIALMFSSLPQTVTVLQILGGCYLIYIGAKAILGVYRAIRAFGLGGEVPLTPPRTGRSLFLQGMLTAFSNPKSIFFFGALYPQFYINVEIPYALHFGMLSVVFTLCVALVHSGYMLSAIAVGRRFVQRRHAVLTITGLTGLFFLSVGLTAVLVPLGRLL